MIEITVRLSQEQAAAIPRSRGFDNGWGVKKAVALKLAEEKVLGAVRAAVQTFEDEKLQHALDLIAAQKKDTAGFVTELNPRDGP